jgi:hypothetical protein
MSGQLKIVVLEILKNKGPNEYLVCVIYFNYMLVSGRYCRESQKR